MRLLNYSAGRVQYHLINGESVPTGYLKTPLPEPWVVEMGGPPGNEKAMHTDDVYAYSVADRNHWEDHFGVPRGTWDDGFFGENLTLSELRLDELRIGDVLALGKQVRLVVAGPRTPCTKLSWRLRQPGSFLKEFLLSGRVGVYLTVLEPGVIHPGDELVVAKETSNPTVAEVTEYYAGTTVPSVDVLEHLLALPELSQSAGVVLGAQLSKAKAAPTKTQGRWAGWRELVVADLVDEAPDLRSVQLRADDGRPLANFHAGQFLSVDLSAQLGAPTIRQWSLSGYAEDPDSYRITVKREDGGRASGYVHGRLRVGDRLCVRAPAGSFRLDDSSFRPAAFIAGGIGVAPLVAMMHAQSRRGPDAPMVHFFFSARRPEHSPFTEELDRLFDQHPEWRRHVVYTRAEDGRAGARLTVARIQELLQGNHIYMAGQRVDFAWFETDFYVCGPGTFQEGIHQGLLDAGAVPDRTTMESFTGLADPVAAAIPSAEVTFARTGRTDTWLATEGRSLLELGRALGLGLDAGCEAGICSTCEVKIIEGSVLDGRAAPRGARSTARLCVGLPATERVVLDA
jgi:ferredoxin-NADP reductase/MOSC domain-containing protein YiiM